MLFLIDAQLPRDLASCLITQGYPARHVADIGLGDAPDERIEAAALRMDAVVWSKDGDFAARARRNPDLPVVWLRFGNIRNRDLSARLRPRLRMIAEALKQGRTPVEVDE